MCLPLGQCEASCQARIFPTGISLVYNIFEEKMPAIKYLCNQCQELFDLLGAHNSDKARCPRCSSNDVQELIACSLETGPPPWEYLCHQCGGGFLIAAPRGPSEEKKIRCPRCGSGKLEWLVTAIEICPPGG